MSLNTAPRTWVVGEIVTAAELNTEVRDAITGIQAGWTAYTPAWTSSGTAPVVNNGVILGKSNRTGHTIMFEINFVPGSSTTFGTGNYTFSVPFGSVSDGITALCHAQLVIGAVRWHGQAIISPGTSTTQPFFSTSSTDPRLTQQSPTAPGTFGSGSLLRITGEYEAA